MTARRAMKKPTLVRLPVPMPLALIRMIDACVPAGQSRAEWIREALRQRILREGPRQE